MNKRLNLVALGVVAVILTLTIMLAVRSTASAPNQTAFVGTWERLSLKSVEGQPLEERLVPSWLLFAPDGHYMQAQLPTGRDNANKPINQMTREELLNRYEGVLATHGTYTVTGNKLTRKYLHSTNPALQGQELIQEFRFEGDTLILKVISEQGKGNEARFRRVK